MKYKLGTKINFLNNKKKLICIYIPALGIILFFFLIIYLNLFVGLIKGYILINDRTDDLHIIKGGEVAIQHTVVDFSIEGDYLIGLRLPANYLECENGTALRIVLKNKKAYFIVDTISHQQFHYLKKDRFVKKLDELGIDNINLDYSSFENIWSKYARYYKNVNVSECKILDKARDHKYIGS